MQVSADRIDYLALKWRAIFWLVVGRKSAALEIFDAMVARWPTDPYALASRSHVRTEFGRAAAALADMRALVDAHPEHNAGHWFNLAFLLEASGEYAEAESAFRRTIALDPKLDRAWYGLGLVLIQLGRHDEAVAALKRNTELQPMSPYGWYQLARVQLDRQRPDETRKIIRHLKGFEPKVAAQLERETGLQA